MELQEAVAIWRSLREMPLNETPIGGRMIAFPFSHPDLGSYAPGTNIETIWTDLEELCAEFSIGKAMEGQYQHLY